jgi:hypothetical protein
VKASAPNSLRTFRRPSIESVTPRILSGLAQSKRPNAADSPVHPPRVSLRPRVRTIRDPLARPGDRPREASSPVLARAHR